MKILLIILGIIAISAPIKIIIKTILEVGIKRYIENIVEFMDDGGWDAVSMTAFILFILLGSIYMITP